MATSEWRDLLRVLDTSSREREPDSSLLAAVLQGLGGAERVDTALLPRVKEQPGGDLEGIVRASMQPSSGPIENTARPNSTVAKSGSGTAETVIKTIGMVTGVGPVVTGLMKLLGGGDDEAEPVAPLPFSLPEQIAVEAGLAGDRSFVPVNTAAGGVARGVSSRQDAAPAATQIQVNVQAMDSRSFLDHSDEIARAVRDAMLHSHSLNDVVAEV